MSERPMDRPGTWSDADLEAALADLGRALAPVGSETLAASVRERVAGLGAPATGHRSRLFGRLRPAGRPLRRAVLLGVAAVLVVAGVVAAIGYGLPGLRIVILGPGSTERPSAAAPATFAPSGGAAASPGSAAASSPGSTVTSSAPSIESLGLGTPIDAAAVVAAAGHRVPLPDLPELGAPLGIFLRGTAPGSVVSAAFGASPAIPAGPLAPVDAGRPVAILVTILPGVTDGPLLEKTLPPGTTIEPVTVEGHPGFWIAGQPHDLLYITPDGSVQREPARLAGNVLAWNDGELTFRVEGAPDLATAQRIAASMR